MLCSDRQSSARTLGFQLLLALVLSSCGGSSDLDGPNPAPEPLADLVAMPIEAPGQVRLDALLGMAIRMGNEGVRIAGPGWFIRVFLSADAEIDPGDMLIDQFVATGELVPGAEDRYLRNMKLPGRVEPATYYLGTILDVTQNVPETNEDNNTLTNPATITILPRSPSDTVPL